jgi:hypothetical protein
LGLCYACVVRIMLIHFAMNQSLVLGRAGADGRVTPSSVLDGIECNPPVGLDLAEVLEASSLYSLTRKQYLRRLSTNFIDVALES